MDIKILLLKSLSLKIPISGTHRIYDKKSCFIIRYEINENILRIKSIKNRKKRSTWLQRIKDYNKAYKINYRKRNNVVLNRSNSTTTIIKYFKDEEVMTAQDVCKHAKDTQTETLKTSTPVKEISTQTINILRHTKEVQTSKIKIMPKIKIDSTSKSTSTQNLLVSLLTSTAQQTIASAKFIRNMEFVNKKSPFKRYSKSCQTDNNTECKGTQYKKSTLTKATCTDVNTRDSFAQVQNDLFNTKSSEKPAKLLSLPMLDFQAFIYLLNEIGEMVTDQNQILNNNSEMMKRIMQFIMLKNSKRMNQVFRAVSTQTDQLLRTEKKHNFSQTKANYKKPRKLLLFKGRSK